MKPEEFNTIFRGRTKCLALRMIHETEVLKYSDALGVIRKQLIRSVTSTEANFRSVCMARPERERYSKLCIVVEEAGETLFWMELMVEGSFTSREKMEPLNKEAEEILKVMSAFKKQVSGNHESLNH